MKNKKCSILNAQCPRPQLRLLPRHFLLSIEHLSFVIGCALLFSLSPFLPAQSAQTPIFNLRTTNVIHSTNWIAFLAHPNATNGTVKIRADNFASNIFNGNITIGALNGWLWFTNGALTIISNGLTGQALTYSNGVPQWIPFPAGAGGGDVTTAQLNTASNVLRFAAVLTNEIAEGNVLYVRTNGNDATALRGRLDKPWLTITGVNAAAIAGDAVLMGLGAFDVGSNVVNFKHGVTYQGHGWDTIINGTNGTPGVHGAQFRVASASFRDFRFRFRDNNNVKYGFGTDPNTGSRMTNALVENVWFEGDTDCLYWSRAADGIYSSIEFRNCKFTSGFDTAVLGGGTNCYFSFFNCDFEITVSGQTNTANDSQYARFLLNQSNDSQGSVVNFKNCTFRSVDALTVFNWHEGGLEDGPYNRVTWENCSWHHTLTNGATARFAGWVSDMFYTNSFLTFAGCNQVRWSTGAAISTNTPGPQIVTLLNTGARTNYLPPIHFINNWTNMIGVEITVMDGSGNGGGAATSVRTRDGALIRGPFGETNSYRIDRPYGWATFLTEGTNWVVKAQSLPIQIGQLQISTSLDVTGPATFIGLDVNGLLQIYAGVNNAFLSGPAVLGLNGNGDHTNVTLAADFSLSGTTLALATNAITARTEDQTPATNDFLLAVDTSVAGFKRVALGNLPRSTNHVAQGIGTADITNAVKRYRHDFGNTTNIVLNWDTTNVNYATPSNTFTVSWINAPSSAEYEQRLYLRIINTNSVSGFFPTNGPNGETPRLLTAPSTNDFVCLWDGVRFTIFSEQIFATGTGDTNVLNLSPTIHNLTLVGAVSNVTQLKFAIWTNYVQTVSNFVFSFSTNRYELKNQTNVVFTNLVEEATAVGADLVVHIHNTTGVTMGLVWPAYGAQHGYFLQTNANNPILTTTTLAAGGHGVASFTAFGSNIFGTFTTWP